MAYVAVRGAELFSVKLPKASQHNFILSEERFDLSRPCGQIVEFASARPSLRCASTIQIVRPLEFTVETRSQLHPAFAQPWHRIRLTREMIARLRFNAACELG